MRLRSFADPAVRAEARRTVIGRGAYNVALSVVAFYVWAAATDRQPGESFVGFMAAAITCSIAAGVVAGFMQPAERDLRALSICRIGPIPEDPPSSPPSPEDDPA